MFVMASERLILCGLARAVYVLCPCFVSIAACLFDSSAAVRSPSVFRSLFLLVAHCLLKSIYCNEDYKMSLGEKKNLLGVLFSELNIFFW